MIASLLLVTLVNANDHTASVFKHALKAGKHIPSASTLMRQYYRVEDWPFEKAISAMGNKVPADVMSMLQQKGKTGKHGKFLSAGMGLLQEDKKKQVEWTKEELDRAREILNKMYDTEQSELDVLMFDCKQYLDGVQGQMDENSRIRLLLGEETAQARADQLESTRSKKEAEGQLEGLKEEYESHQMQCSKTLTAKRAELTMAEMDYTVAMKIQNSTECTDEQIAEAIAADEAAEAPPPAMLLSKSKAVSSGKANTITSCSMGGGSSDDDEADSMFFYFGGLGEHKFHTKAAKFAMQRAAKMAMDRKLGKHSFQHKLPLPVTLLETSTTTGTTTAVEIPIGEEAPEPAEEPAELAPGYKCNVNAVPNCPLLNDAISTMVGELRDTFVKVKTDFESTKAHCDALSADFESQIEDWQAIHDRAEVTLAKSITTIDTNQAEGKAKAKEYTELETQWNLKNEECETKKLAILDTMCGIKVVRLELYKLANNPELFQDCEVGDWAPEACSVTCAGGQQFLTRPVLQEPKGGSECPPLQMEQACNEFPCPIDCGTDDWSEWSACSKDCGGGVKARSRNIVTEPEFGGEECPPTSDTVMCNVGSCDVDCTLAEWTPWSDCSKACNGGISVRTRPTLTEVQGAGTCPDPECSEKGPGCDEDRFDQLPCNDMKCDDNVVCSSMVDVVLLMDGSGSVRSKGYKQEKEFAELLMDRLSLSEEGAKAGVILFSKKIEILQEMTTDNAAVIAAIEGAKFPGRTTNTAEALATSLDVLMANGRSAASSVVFAVTDGMPNDVEATTMMAKKVKEKARLIFVAVGKNLDMDMLYSWASFPPEMNVLTAKKFKHLETSVGDYLADICPALKCNEDISGAGEDYIGCQDKTVTGKVCQAWDDQFPHKHKQARNAKKGKKNLGKHNFCRNPDGEDSIWCYTTDPNVRWELCEPRNSTLYSPVF